MNYKDMYLYGLTDELTKIGNEDIDINNEPSEHVDGDVCGDTVAETYAMVTDISQLGMGLESTLDSMMLVDTNIRTIEDAANGKIKLDGIGLESLVKETNDQFYKFSDINGLDLSTIGLESYEAQFDNIAAFALEDFKANLKKVVAWISKIWQQIKAKLLKYVEFAYTKLSSLAMNKRYEKASDLLKDGKVVISAKDLATSFSGINKYLPEDIYSKPISHIFSNALVEFLDNTAAMKIISSKYYYNKDGKLYLKTFKSGNNELMEIKSDVAVPGADTSLAKEDNTSEKDNANISKMLSFNIKSINNLLDNKITVVELYDKGITNIKNNIAEEKYSEEELKLAKENIKYYNSVAFSTFKMNVAALTGYIKLTNLIIKKSK